MTRKILKNKTILPLVWLIILTIPQTGNSSIAQGTLKGRVVDAESGEPLPGANIILKATTLGTISDKNGFFVLENVPNGRYNILISMIGYKPGVFDNTFIGVNQTTKLDVKLKSTFILAPELIVTANKSIQRVQDSPVSIAVLSDQEIRQKNSITIQDALRFIPGLYMTDDQVNIRGSTGYNKGAGSRVLILLDGVPAIAGDTGGINWDALPPTEIARVEVVKGAGSALYGSNAMGGIINLITKEPTTTPVTRSRISWGYYDDPSYSSWKFTDRMLQFNAIDVSHSRKTGKLSMILSAGRKTSTGYRQNGQYKIWNGFGKFHYRFSPQSHFILMTDYTFNNHGNILTWKGPATNDPLRISPESIGDKIHSGKFITHLTFKTMLRSNLALISKSSLYRNSWQDFFHDNNDYAKTSKLQQEIQIEYQPTVRHNITGGSEFTYYQTHSSMFGNPFAYDIAGYLQDEFKFAEPLRITVGGRYDHHQMKDLFSEDQFSPKLGIVVQPSPFSAIRLSAGKGFRAASIAEIFTNTIVSGFEVRPNLNLQAESVNSYELGLHQILGSGLMIDAAVFRNHYQNMIEPTLFIELESFIPKPVIQLDNLAETQIQGLEISVKTNFWQKRISVNAGYTYLDARRLGEIPTTFSLDDFSHTPSSTLAYRPKHLFQASINGRYRQFLLGLDYRYISRFDEVLAYINDIRIDQRVIDIYFEAQLSTNLQLSVRANNLLNYNYTEVERNLAPMRNFVFTVNSHF
ncbi:MAG TPA: TonB-dependent receptor [Bacteroidetes bacterium]|nr:TonB-dependent receptor [Bacteroidota bacterium]